MISRCELPGLPGYKNYGGRGISICERWRNDFWAFADDMGEKPTPLHTIDRIDVNGNYSPENCRWASKTEQARNKQKTRIVEINGTKYHVADLQDKYGVNMRTIHYRASLGWDFEKVVSRDRHYNNTESQKKAVQVHAEKKRNQTHCKHGHELTEDNVYLYKGSRHCKKCRRAMDRYLYYKKARPLSDFL